jgi:acyl carrier protein
MNRDEIRLSVLSVLRTIAPEMDPLGLDPGANLREQLDIDSMDFLNFVIRLHERFQVDVPEVDYVRLLTLDDCVGYLAGKMPVSPGA